MADESKEEVKQAPVEQLSEEIKPAQEQLSEKKEEQLASKTEEVKTEPVPVVENKESLSEDIKATKEELSIIKEARDELIASYAKYNDIKTEKEQLSKDLDSVKADNAKMKEQLQRYVKAEEEFNIKQRQVRVEQLSEKFKQLGQEKTAEQLSAKSDEILSEMETIVDAALKMSRTANIAPSVITPSQSIVKESLSSDKKVEVKKVVAVKPTQEQLKKNFFAGVLNTMAKEQIVKSNRAKEL